MSDAKTEDVVTLREAVGMCIDCQYARTLANKKGNAFYRCERARHDETLMAYPPLPVRDCHGFAPKGESQAR